MRRIIGIGGIVTAAVVLVWRLCSEALDERRRMVATGELAARLKAREAARYLRAGVRVPQVERVRVHAAVHVGSSRRSDVDDIDDVGLLEGAMRRSTRAVTATPRAGPASLPERAPTPAPRPIARDGRPAVASVPPIDTTGHEAPPQRAASASARFAPPRSDHAIRVALRAQDDPVDVPEPTPAWTIVVGVIAVLITLVSLVRPLGTASPWIALAGVSLAAIAWIAARRDG